MQNKLYNSVTTAILTDRRNATMHVPRSDRSLDFIARGCSPITLLLHIPVVLLVILFGLSISNPFVAASVTTWVIYIGRLLDCSPDTVLLLGAVIPVLHALVQHHNRRHGVGGGRITLYMGVYLAPIAFACLYYIGLAIILGTMASIELIPCPAPFPAPY